MACGCGCGWGASEGADIGVWEEYWGRGFSESWCGAACLYSVPFHTRTEPTQSQPWALAWLQVSCRVQDAHELLGCGQLLLWLQQCASAPPTTHLARDLVLHHLLQLLLLAPLEHLQALPLLLHH